MVWTVLKDKYGVSQGNKGRGCGMAAGPAAQITEVGNCTHPGKRVPGAGTGVCIRGRGLEDDK